MRGTHHLDTGLGLFFRTRFDINLSEYTFKHGPPYLCVAEGKGGLLLRPRSKLLMGVFGRVAHVLFVLGADG